MAKRRAKKKVKKEFTTADGTGIFPDHLAKMNELAARARALLMDRKLNQFRHPEFRVQSMYAGAIYVYFIYEDGEELVYNQNDNREHAFLDKDCLDEALDALRRETVLDDLGDIL